MPRAARRATATDLGHRHDGHTWRLLRHRNRPMSRQQRRQRVVATCRPTCDLELEDRHTRVVHADGEGHLPMVLPRRRARRLP